MSGHEDSAGTIPAQKSHKYARSGEEMLDVLAHDIMRYEMLSEQEEYRALASVLQGDQSEIEFELCEVDVAGPETSNPSDNSTETDTGATNKRYKEVSLEDTDRFLVENTNKNTKNKTQSDTRLFTDWILENQENRKLEEIPASELDMLLARFYLSK